jgi:hypothetical protein
MVHLNKLKSTVKFENQHHRGKWPHCIDRSLIILHSTGIYSKYDINDSKPLHVDAAMDKRKIIAAVPGKIFFCGFMIFFVVNFCIANTLYTKRNM